jgi:hypothetical protein
VVFFILLLLLLLAVIVGGADVGVIDETFLKRSVIFSLYISNTDNLIDTELNSVALILLERSNKHPAVLIHNPRSAKLSSSGPVIVCVCENNGNECVRITEMNVCL